MHQQKGTYGAYVLSTYSISTHIVIGIKRNPSNLIERKTMDEIIKQLKRIVELLSCISDNQDQINSHYEELQEIDFEVLHEEITKLTQ